MGMRGKNSNTGSDRASRSVLAAPQAQTRSQAQMSPFERDVTSSSVVLEGTGLSGSTFPSSEGPPEYD